MTHTGEMYQCIAELEHHPHLWGGGWDSADPPLLGTMKNHGFWTSCGCGKVVVVFLVWKCDLSVDFNIFEKRQDRGGCCRIFFLISPLSCYICIKNGQFLQFLFYLERKMAKPRTYNKSAPQNNAKCSFMSSVLVHIFFHFPC